MSEEKKESEQKKTQTPGWDNPPKVEQVILEKAENPKKNDKRTQKLCE